jgi:outer membrane immunogenic protein
MSGSDNWSGSVVDHGNQEFDAEIAGLKVGAGMTLGSILYIGAEVDGAAAFGDYNELLPVGSGYEAELNYLTSARLRAGVVFDRTMIYGTVGGAIMDLDRTFFRPNGEKDDVNQLAYGTTYGVGIEFGLSDNLRLFGEYRVTDYSDIEETSMWAPSVETNELTTNALNVGLNYAFN